jgi:hypothetical protein
VPILHRSTFCFSIANSFACEETPNSVIDSPVTDTQHTTHLVLSLECRSWWVIRWGIVWSISIGAGNGYFI